MLIMHQRCYFCAALIVVFYHNNTCMKAYVPNSITLCNLLLGCIAIVCLFNEQLSYVPFLLLAAGWADFFDGFAARVLKVSSPLGLQLDSLADMVTFGVVPGMIMYELLGMSYEHWGISYTFWHQLPAFLITLFSALRLAKFNIDERQSDSFIGLPTPSSTLFVGSLILVLDYDRYGLTEVVLNPIFLGLTTIILSYLLVAELPLFALKFKHAAWKGNELRYILIVSGFAMLFGLGYSSVPLIVVLYLLLALIDNKILQNKNA